MSHSWFVKRTGLLLYRGNLYHEQGSYSNPHFADTSRKPQLIKPDVTIAIKTLTTHDIFQMRHNYESLKNWSRQGMSNLEALIFEFLKLFRMKVTWLESMMPIGCRSIAFNFNQCQQLILVSFFYIYIWLSGSPVVESGKSFSGQCEVASCCKNVLHCTLYLIENVRKKGGVNCISIWKW